MHSATHSRTACAPLVRLLEASGYRTRCPCAVRVCNSAASGKCVGQMVDQLAGSGDRAVDHQEAVHLVFGV